jgi:hypothetical protein
MSVQRVDEVEVENSVYALGVMAPKSCPARRDPSWRKTEVLSVGLGVSQHLLDKLS